MTTGPDTYLQKELDTAVKAARVAGAFLVDNLLKPGDVAYKGEGFFNPCIAADKQAEAIIIGVLEAAFPEHDILSEESGRLNRGAGYEWIIDPLDGTVNYLHGHRHFGVSIALRHGDNVVLGVVYNPVLDEMFTAAKGRGAFLNARPVAVSRTDTLEKSLAGMGFPYGRSSPEFRQSLAGFTRLVGACQALRRDGSTALALCHVACGRYDGFYVAGNEIWDYAAGTLLVAEAGGIVTGGSGGEFSMAETQGSVLASNGVIHEALLGLLGD